MTDNDYKRLVLNIDPVSGLTRAELATRHFEIKTSVSIGAPLLYPFSRDEATNFVEAARPFEASPAYQALVNPTFKPKTWPAPRAHKPSIVCANAGCELCAAEGNRLDAQLVQYKVL